MADYRRYFVAGGMYFFTLVTYQRRFLFHDPRNVELLRTAITSVRREMPFEINAAVILPDHLHFIWSLPPGDSDYSKRIGQFKVRFTKPFHSSTEQKPVVSESRARHRESDIWQRRFWEHTITDEDEFQHLFDYIHFNPVKHGHATCPHAWKASSFHNWVERGVLDQRWGCSCNGRTVNMNFRSVEDVVSEQGGQCPPIPCDDPCWWPTLTVHSVSPVNLCSRKHIVHQEWKLSCCGGRCVDAGHSRAR